jgi:hypothetical protein
MSDESSPAVADRRYSDVYRYKSQTRGVASPSIVSEAFAPPVRVKITIDYA